MDIMDIINFVASVTTILLIFFKIKNPKGISIQVFICLLITVCGIVFALNYITNSKDSGSEVPVANAPTTNADKGDGYDDNPESPEPMPPVSSEEEMEPLSELQSISPLERKAYNVALIEDSSYEILPNEIIKLSGEIVSKDQIIEYEYIPTISGTYRFEFSDVPNGTDLILGIYNSGKKKIIRYSDLDNGDGITYSLNAGEKYYICVGQYNNFGTYVLNVGQKKEIFDISNYTTIFDSIQYTHQENDYLYIPQYEGTHRFEFSNVPNGTDLRLTLFNSGWEKIISYSDLDNGGGITYFLTPEEYYYIRVTQYSGSGSYTLNIGFQKEIRNISDYNSISDSIQYKDQTNSYSYTAEYDGTHRFEFSDVPNGMDLRLTLFNSGWEKIIGYSDLDNGDGITYQLTAGEIYYISVAQYKEVGSYILNIGEKKPTPDISSWSGVSDSIQYTDQKNDYLLVPRTDGMCHLTLSSVSEGNSFNMTIYNSGWEKLTSSSNKSIDVSLSKDEFYYIQVTQRQGSIGEYRLLVNY